MASVFLGDLNDFIQPSQACVNPLFAGSSSSSSTSTSAAGFQQINGAEQHRLADGRSGQSERQAVNGQRKGAAISLSLEGMSEEELTMEPDLIKATAANTAKVSLSDCLACSGCVTSAETVLITQQGEDKFRAEVISGRYKVVVVSVGAAARASLAAYLQMRIADVMARLITFLKSEGVNCVLDASIGGYLSIIESRHEFVSRLRSLNAGSVGWTRPPFTTALNSHTFSVVDSGRQAEPQEVMFPDSGALPLLVSACPGWVCYAEKTAPEALPYMSSAKSAQQCLGSVVKGVLADVWGVSAEEILHVSMEACFDKKLEASRRDFFHEDLQTTEVDMVLTTQEIVDMMTNAAVSAVAAGTIAQGGAVEMEETTKTPTTLAPPPSSRFKSAEDDKNIYMLRRWFQSLTPSPLSSPIAPGVPGSAIMSVLTTTTTTTAVEEGSSTNSIDDVNMTDAFTTSPSSSSSSSLVKDSSSNQCGITRDSTTNWLLGHVSEEGGSGGYLEGLFRYAAKEVYGVDLEGQRLVYKQGRNVDVKEVSLETVEGRGGGGSSSSKVLLRGAIVNGFRNIQSLIQMIKRGKCPYQVVEVMACPSGCLNGGGQVKVKNETPKEMRERIVNVDRIFHDIKLRRPEDNPLVNELYRTILGGAAGSQQAKQLLHTSFHAVPKLEVANPMLSAW